MTQQALPAAAEPLTACSLAALADHFTWAQDDARSTEPARGR